MRRSIVVVLLSFITISSNAQNEELEAVKTPIWSKEDVAKQGGRVHVYTATLQMKPPFYEGPIPLEFKAGKETIIVNMTAMVYHDFNDFRNTFIYIDASRRLRGIAEGAITTDTTGRLLAEARFTRMINNETGQLRGIELEEFHYNEDGKLIFICKSEYDFPIGFKRRETEVIGSKQRDYYFIWPVTNF